MCPYIIIRPSTSRERRKRGKKTTVKDIVLKAMISTMMLMGK